MMRRWVTSCSRTSLTGARRSFSAPRDRAGRRGGPRRRASGSVEPAPSDGHGRGVQAHGAADALELHGTDLPEGDISPACGVDDLLADENLARPGVLRDA